MRPALYLMRSANRLSCSMRTKKQDVDNFDPQPSRQHRGSPPEAPSRRTVEACEMEHTIRRNVAPVAQMLTPDNECRDQHDSNLPNDLLSPSLPDYKELFSDDIVSIKKLDIANLADIIQPMPAYTSESVGSSPPPHSNHDRSTMPRKSSLTSAILSSPFVPYPVEYHEYDGNHTTMNHTISSGWGLVPVNTALVKHVERLQEEKERLEGVVASMHRAFDRDKRYIIRSHKKEARNLLEQLKTASDELDVLRAERAERTTAPETPQDENNARVAHVDEETKTLTAKLKEKDSAIGDLQEDMRKFHDQVRNCYELVLAGEYDHHQHWSADISSMINTIIVKVRHQSDRLSSEVNEHESTTSMRPSPEVLDLHRKNFDLEKSLTCTTKNLEAAQAENTKLKVGNTKLKTENTKLRNNISSGEEQSELVSHVSRLANHTGKAHDNFNDTRIQCNAADQVVGSVLEQTGTIELRPRSISPDESFEKPLQVANDCSHRPEHEDTLRSTQNTNPLSSTHLNQTGLTIERPAILRSGTAAAANECSQTSLHAATTSPSTLAKSKDHIFHLTQDLLTIRTFFDSQAQRVRYPRRRSFISFRARSQPQSA